MKTSLQKNVLIYFNTLFFFQESVEDTIRNFYFKRDIFFIGHNVKYFILFLHNVSRFKCGNVIYDACTWYLLDEITAAETLKL